MNSEKEKACQEALKELHDFHRTYGVDELMEIRIREELNTWPAWKLDAKWLLYIKQEAMRDALPLMFNEAWDKGVLAERERVKELMHNWNSNKLETHLLFEQLFPQEGEGDE